MLEKIVLFFLFFLPFQFALNPNAETDLAAGRVVAVVIFVWWLVRSLAKRKIQLPPLYFTAIFVSFLGIATISFLWVENISFAFRKILFLLNFFPLLFVFYDGGKEKINYSLWLKAVCVGSLAAALVGLGIFVSQFLFGVAKVFFWLINTILPFFLGGNLGQAVSVYPSLLVNSSGTTLLRVTAFFPDPHVASLYFGMNSFLALGLFLQEKKRIFIFVSMILILADLLTFSRGGYLGFLTGTIVFLFMGWKSFSLHIKKWLTMSFVLGGIIMLLFGQPILSRFLSSFVLEDTSSTARVVLWREAIENIKERPLLGTGLGNYILAVNPAEDYRTPYYAHNLYLDVATELGLVGLFFFLLILFIPLFFSVRNYTQTKNFFFLSLSAALVLYLTHSFFETALYSVHILPLLLFVLSLALLSNENEQKEKI